MAQREIVVGNIGTDDPLGWDWKLAENERLGPDGIRETEMIWSEKLLIESQVLK